MRLKVLLLSNNRGDLLAQTLNSVALSLHGFSYTFIVVNHDGNINQGREKLLSHINEADEWLLMLEDDWICNEDNGYWISDAITLLQKNKDVAFIRLRRDGDGQNDVDHVEKRHGIDIVECWRSGFTHNPHICHADLYRKLLPVPMKKNLEIEFGKRYNELGYKTAKLNQYNKYGVFTHIGGGRGFNF